MIKKKGRRKLILIIFITEIKMPKITNVNVYWLDESIVASWYPMLKEYKEDIGKEIAENLNIHSKRASKLGKASIGSWHDNFLNWIIVQFDLTASLKARPEIQRYHFMDFVSSMSTMHRITSMKPTFNEFVSQTSKDELLRLIEEYNKNQTKENKLRVLYNIPTWFELTARMTTNYRQLKTIYHQRGNHLLPDWRMFCDWIETLPHSELITND